MPRAPRNRTLELTEAEHRHYAARLRRLRGPVSLPEILDRTICQDLFEVLPWLPAASVDLLFADPPYNLSKNFGERRFAAGSLARYEAWLETWLPPLVRVLKPSASIYICGDWRSSAAIHRVLARLCTVHNRITWEREKGRGARSNWKNCSEDIWFGTLSPRFTFDAAAVRLCRRVRAPYTDAARRPKDWHEHNGDRLRLTYASNLWTDLTVPFWSMSENTAHPTQKPEKLMAKIILASSRPGAVILDPFLGSGTTSVVARKLGRHYIGIEIDEDYACLAEKRLDLAAADPAIQGYAGDVFWERNSGPKPRPKRSPPRRR